MGPLTGLRIVEIASIGPGPFCAMLLADMGAEVIRVDRPGGPNIGSTSSPKSAMLRGRRSIVVDLKSEGGLDVLLRLLRTADILIEGFRPGVAERLGFGPEVCWQHNPGLIYGRMTGWGQEGELSHRAGHDINYIAMAGVLGAIGHRDQPVPPLNLIGDYGGGGMLLAFGVMCALWEARTAGRGQVVDAAMVDGASLLMAPIYDLLGRGLWIDERESNPLDGAAPFYTTYECADGRFVAVGALEPKFYSELLDGLGLEADRLPDRDAVSAWPVLREAFAERFAARTRDDWANHFQDTDACVAPVLSLHEAPKHQHAVTREAFVEAGGQPHPAPAPRLERTPGAAGPPLASFGHHTDSILGELGYDASDISDLRDRGAVE